VEKKSQQRKKAPTDKITGIIFEETKKKKEKINQKNYKMNRLLNYESSEKNLHPKNVHNVVSNSKKINKNE